MSSTNAKGAYFVYAKGRWREVDAGTGAVVGLAGGRRPRFLYVSRNKLIVARSGHVLKGLKDLAAGEPSTVKLGRQLPWKSPSRSMRRVRDRKCGREGSCCGTQHHCCQSHQAHGCHCSGVVPMAQSSIVKNLAVRDFIESRTINASPIKRILEERKHLEASDDSDQENVPEETNVKRVTKIKRSQNDDNRNKPSPKKRKLFNPNYISEEKLKRTSTNGSGTNVLSPKKVPAISRERSKNRKIADDTESSDNEPIRNKIVKYRKRLPSTSDSDFESESHNFNERLGDTNFVRSDKKSPKIDTHKELIIDESDVSVLRRFFARTRTDFDVNLFDSNDDYKSLIFFKINPLVSIEPCPRIDEILRSQRYSSEETMPLKEFAAKLGLKSRTEVEKPRRVTRQVVKSRNRKTDDADKENHMEAGNSNGIRIDSKNELNQQVDNTNMNAKISDTIRSTTKSDADKPHRAGREKKTKVEFSNESKGEAAKTKSRVKDAKSRKVLNRPERNVSKRSGDRREYSTLEDHAIVAFISNGGRERLVNGNRVWKELQGEHTALTGQERSWHSLRNRYLRYILPALHLMALPQQQQRALRAGAATGELKSKKQKCRRNSIFNVPAVRSASARHARPARTSRAGPEAERDGDTWTPRGANNAPTTSTPVDSARKLRSDRPGPTSLSDRSDRSGPVQSSSDQSGSASSSDGPGPASRTNRPGPASRTNRSGPATRDRDESPSYSEITRAFARRHRPIYRSIVDK